MIEIDDAIEAAAGDRDSQICSNPVRQRSARAAVSRARNTISAFLQALPDEMTVFELKELLERSAH